MYKTFSMIDSEHPLRRVGTIGFQKKFITEDNLFIKEQVVINGTERDDWLVEVFSCKIATALGLGDRFLMQKPCILDYGTHKKYGVYSVNFERFGERFLSFQSLLELKGDDIKAYNFENLSTPEKIQCMTDILAKYTGLPADDCKEYIIYLALIDIMVGNMDRHRKNIGCMIDENGEFAIAPILDNGLGLGEFVQDKLACKTYEDFERESYVAPYGEDPCEMLRILHKEYGIGNLLKRHLPKLRRLARCRMPDNAFARPYYKKVLKTIEEL